MKVNEKKAKRKAHDFRLIYLHEKDSRFRLIGSERRLQSYHFATNNQMFTLLSCEWTETYASTHILRPNGHKRWTKTHPVDGECFGIAFFSPLRSHVSVAKIDELMNIKCLSSWSIVHVWTIGIRTRTQMLSLPCMSHTIASLKWVIRSKQNLRLYFIIRVQVTHINKILWYTFMSATNGSVSICVVSGGAGKRGGSEREIGQAH